VKYLIYSYQFGISEVSWQYHAATNTWQRYRSHLIVSIVRSNSVVRTSCYESQVIVPAPPASLVEPTNLVSAVTQAKSTFNYTVSATEHVTAKIYLVLAITIIGFWNGMNSSHILAACVQINPSTFNITGSAL
jgi:hypothetical protein